MCRLLLRCTIAFSIIDTMKESLSSIIDGADLYTRQFGNYPRIIESKRKMLRVVWEEFQSRFSHRIVDERLYLITVPNRIELLGKHTDYQGGETLLLTGPKNFFALAAPAADGVSELVNADYRLGKTSLKLGGKEPEMLSAGVGSNYTFAVAKRLSHNLKDAGCSPLEDVKAVFIGDIPFGGGTSGSSAKLITDFLIFASVNRLLTDNNFISLIVENGKKSGLELNQRGVDDFSLALSMYVAHHENGLDFGDLKGDRGVGTFGGSEDHTAIMLGKRGRLLYCRYCPTQILEILNMPEDCHVCVAYSGRKADKTGDAMVGFNRLSQDAGSAVQALIGTNHSELHLLRDFFSEMPADQRAAAAYERLKREDRGIAERAYQFFKEREITERGVTCLKANNLLEYGRLLNGSHENSRRYLKNIAPEVDFLQSSANEMGALGASGFGAGFGGSCYAVVKSPQPGDFIDRWKRAYVKSYPQLQDRAQFDLYPACNGCHCESLEDFE